MVRQSVACLLLVVILISNVQMTFCQGLSIFPTIAVVAAASPRVRFCDIPVKTGSRIKNIRTFRDQPDWLGFELEDGMARGEIHRGDVQFVLQLYNSNKIPMTALIWNVEKKTYVRFRADTRDVDRVTVEPGDTRTILLASTGTYKLVYRTSDGLWVFGQEFKLPHIEEPIPIPAPPAPMA